MSLRPVHDILYSARWDGRAVCSFVQWGTSEEGYEYEVVCPWCAETVGYVIEEVDEEGPLTLNYRELVQGMRAVMLEHVDRCKAGSYRLSVERTRVPLHTEKRTRVM